MWDGAPVERQRPAVVPDRSSWGAASLGMGGQCDLINEVTGTYGLDDPGLVSCLVLLRRDPQLAELAVAWASLPTAIRAGIVTMIRATRQDID